MASEQVVTKFDLCWIPSWIPQRAQAAIKLRACASMEIHVTREVYAASSCAFVQARSQYVLTCVDAVALGRRLD